MCCPCVQQMPALPALTVLPRCSLSQALVKGGRTAGVLITLPYLSIRCEQMAPSKPQQV